MTPRKDERMEKKPQKDFDEVLLEVRRVTRVTTGGRQLSFRAIILVGNKKGKIGLGLSKGSDVSIAVKKATNEAYKNIVVTPLNDAMSIPYVVQAKYKSASIKLLPATMGTGIKAGSSVRTVLGLAGYTNMLSKIMGSNNKLNNALATIAALSSFKQGKFPKKKAEPVAEEEGTEEAPVSLTPPTKKAVSAEKPATKTPATKAPAKKKAA
jgi:small subunit ribosomal protein S5